MSRSKRKSPVVGMTTARSEKQDKRWNNRLLRRKIHQAIHQGDDILPHVNEVSNPWSMDKDGKRRFDPHREPKLIRK
jgi:hypothetical protein